MPDSIGFAIVGDGSVVFRLRFRGTGMSDNPQVLGGRGFTLLELEEGKISRQWYSESWTTYAFAVRPTGASPTHMI